MNRSADPICSPGDTLPGASSIVVNDAAVRSRAIVVLAATFNGTRKRARPDGTWSFTDDERAAARDIAGAFGLIPANSGINYDDLGRPYKPSEQVKRNMPPRGQS